MRYKNTETFEDGMGRKYSVSGPCMCGALDCEECRPGNNYEKREQEARGETYCMQCEDHQLSEFADETLCEKCGKPFGFVWGIFPKDQGFHRIQWAIPEDTSDKALRLFFREVGITYTEDSYDACAEGFWVLPMEGHPDWTEWNECTPPKDYLALIIGEIPWLAERVFGANPPGGDSPKIDIDAIMAANPVLQSPEMGADLRRWTAVETVINAEYGDRTPAERAVLIGAVMEALK